MKKVYFCVPLVLLLIIFLIPHNNTLASFEDDKRSIVWETAFNDADSNDLGGFYNDIIETGNGTLMVAGTRHASIDQNSGFPSTFDSLIAKYDENGTLLTHKVIQDTNGYSSEIKKILKLSNGNYVAVVHAYDGVEEKNSSLLIFDDNLMLINSYTYLSANAAYLSATFNDVVETSKGLSIAAHLISSSASKIKIPLYLETTLSLSNFNSSLAPIVSSNKEFDGSLDFIADHSANTYLSVVSIQNPDTREYQYTFTEYNKMFPNYVADPNVSTKYNGQVIDVLIDSNNIILILIKNSTGTYEVHRYDNSLAPLPNLSVSLDGNQYNSIEEYDENIYVVSGNKSENHHYVITDGIISKSHSYVSGIFNKTLSKGNGLLISVGMHYNMSKASVIATNIYHDVTFNTNGSDSIISDQSVFSNDLAIKPSDPTRTSFVFEGWYVDSNLSQLFDFQTPITSDITLYAKWGVSSPVNNNVTLSFDSNGGSTVAAQTLVQGDRANKPGNPTRSGYTFDAWYSDASLQTPFDFNNPLNSDITVYAKWIPNPPAITNVTLSFDSNGGSAVVAQTILQGNTASKPVNPTRSGYTFDAWYSDASLQTLFDFGKSLITDTTVYAQWIPTPPAINNVTLSFDSNGGSAVVTQTIVQGNTASKPGNPTRSGYTFDAWYRDASLQTPFDFNNPLNSDITVYAKWIPTPPAINNVTLSFDSNGGSAVVAQTIVQDNTASKPGNPTRSGYTFDAWYSDASLQTLFDFGKSLNTDTTVYAKWIPNPPAIINVTLNFDSNGGSAVASQTLVQGDSASKPSDPTRSGYTFDSWYSDASLQTPFEFSSSLNSDTTVYAKWNEVKAKIESDVLPSTGYQNSATIIAISIVVLGGMILIARKRNKY